MSKVNLATGPVLLSGYQITLSQFIIKRELLCAAEYHDRRVQEIQQFNRCGLDHDDLYNNQCHRRGFKGCPFRFGISDFLRSQ